MGAGIDSIDVAFAKKNKIVWKGAKTRISRKTTFGELKVILNRIDASKKQSKELV